MSDGEVPEDRCGFVLEPNDVPEEWAAAYDSGSERWHVVSEAACCWREVCDGAGDGRCIWHADTDNESADAFIEAHADGAERLDGASVPAVEMCGAVDFEGCGLQAANFDGTGLQGASFAGVQGRFAQFPDADLQGAQFPYAHLRGAQFPNAHLSFAQFFDADLRRTQFSDVNLYRAQFPDANLQMAQFPGAFLLGAQFPDANLQSTQFSDANLQSTQFSNTDLRRAQFSNADLRGAQFSDANLAGTQFSDANLAGVKFSDADLAAAKFSDADLTTTDLSDADASDVDFKGATLENATLTGANLADADLTDARLHGAHLRDVRINARTTIKELAPEEADADWFADTNLSSLNRLRWWWTWWSADPNSLEDHHRQLDRAHTVYRTIQRLYRENSMPEEIDEYHVRAKDIRRKQAIIDSDWLRWLYLAGQRWVMRYGERPRRVVYTSLGVIVVSALLYPLVGGINRPPPPDGTTRVAFDAVPLVPFGVPEPVATVLTSLYFSVVTFTTLGYGDLQPATGVAQAVATVESLVGALLMALLVYVLGRRATR